MTKCVMSIGGSDPSGGAGIQADLKTFCSFGVYGMAAITALTVQNTLGVYDIHTPPEDFLRMQITKVFDDIPPHAIKIGMLSNEANVSSVVDCLLHYRVFSVLDPVIQSSSGTLLLNQQALSLLYKTLLPLVTVVTPNIPEIAVLLNIDEPCSRETMLAAAKKLQAQTRGHVFLKGGHLDGHQSVDVLVTNEQKVHWFEAERIDTENSHGTGCTLSAAIAAQLAITNGDILRSIGRAKTYVFNALRQADKLNLGQGKGPLNHLI